MRLSFTTCTQANEETTFKLKKTTKMAKVFTKYAEARSVNARSLRFLLDGELINWEDTVGDLDLEDGDQIDCMLEQVGGASL